MDTTEAEDRATATPRHRPRSEQARAAAYLDLWERHLALAAIEGPEPWPNPTPSRPGSGA